MTESMDYKLLAALSTTSTFDSSSLPLEILNCTVHEVIPVVQDDGIRGERSRVVERLAMGNIAIAGGFDIEPTPVELDYLFRFATGSGSNPTWTLSDSLIDMYMCVEKVAKVETWLLRITSLTLSSGPGQKLRVHVEVVGKTLTLGASGSYSGTIPAINVASRPYMFYDSVLTINSIQYEMDEFRCTIDNKIEPTYMNGQTASDLEPTDRIVTVNVRTKYTTAEAVLQTDKRAGTPRAASVVFTNGTVSLTLTFAALLGPSESPIVDRKTGKMRLRCDYQAYKSGSTKELVITNDSTP